VKIDRNLAAPLTCFLMASFLLCISSEGQMPAPPGQVGAGEKPKFEAYLFAHMTSNDYGRLYYSVSKDGLHWRTLNGGKRVFDAYHGHPSICKGHDERYYLVGNRGDDKPDINFWVSEDLAHWDKYSAYVPDLTQIPDYPKALRRIGAPKLFYDEASSQYLLTWHTTHDLGKTDLPEPYWAGQRTIYVTSRDLKSFSVPPRKLFSWDMATIDVSVIRAGGRYFAILKDERYPTVEWPNGKTIRICSSTNLCGPYGAPGPPLSPSFREAPMLIPSPNGKAWYLYYEQYPGIAYGLSAAISLDGPWFQVAGSQRPEWDKFSVPPGVRHGCMLPISDGQYRALISLYGAEIHLEREGGG
jgi:hypothetical protein